MNVSLFIEKLYGCKKYSVLGVNNMGAIAITLLGVLFTSQAYGVVPVVESKPVMDAYSSEKILPSNPAQPVPANAGTAQLLQTMDQLRDEIMNLRGQIEEQAHQVQQLQKESRDRYLDLDERVSRLSVPSTTRIQDEVSAVGKAPDLVLSPASTAKETGEFEEQAYEKAFQLIRNKDFNDAKKALKQQLIDYPNGDYSDNAQYWLGEIYMAEGDYKDAGNAFQILIDQYPQSPKVPDATYKLGRIAEVTGNQDDAEGYFRKVMKIYPESAAAQLSKKHLQSLAEH